MNAENTTRVALVSLYNRDFAFGVRYLSTVLKAHGHGCDLVFFKRMASVSDPTLCLELEPNANVCEPHTPREMDILIETLRSLDPDLVGISVISSFFGLAADITARIRKAMDVPIIWGGIHATLCADEAVRHADIVCVGEGEGPLLDLAEALHESRDVGGIPNLWVRRSDGSIEKSDVRPLVENLDALGFPDFDNDDHKFFIDRDDCRQTVPVHDEHPGATIDLMTSRGCPFGCTYCCVPALKQMFKERGSYLRRRSVASVIEEITGMLLTNPDAQVVHFWDDVFTFDRQWTESFAAAYQRSVGLPFVCYAHPRYTDPGILATLKEAGLYCVNVGVQSASQRTCRDVYHREPSAAAVLKAARTLHRLGLRPWYDLIVDNPYENDEDYRATLDLLLALPLPFDINLHSMCYFPGTLLTERALEDGFISAEQVEGADRKGVDQFRMSLDRKREPGVLFWIVLIAMTRHAFVPRRLIAWCSRRRFLRRRPRVPAAIARWSLKAIVRARRLRARLRRTPPQVITRFERALDERTHRLAATIRNRTRRRALVTVALRIYPARDPVYPERYLGAWNLPLWVPPGTRELEADVSFPFVAFRVDGQPVGAAEQWVGDFREAGLYRIQVILLNRHGRPIHEHTLSGHASALFVRPDEPGETTTP